jgi:hypothetical protein
MTRKSKGKIELLNANEHLADSIWAIEAGIVTDQFKGAVAMLHTLKVA